MAYEWTQLLRGTLLNNSHIDELHTNLNTERIARNDQIYSELPESVDEGDIILNDLIVAFRNATNYLVNYNGNYSFNFTSALKIKKDHLKEIRQVVDDSKNNARCYGASCQNLCGSASCSSVSCRNSCNENCSSVCRNSSCDSLCTSQCYTACLGDCAQTTCQNGCYGEAQLHPYFYTMVERIKENRPDISVGLLTNGKLINEENLEKFKGDDIYISILGNKTNTPTYNEITGLNWNDLKIKAQMIINKKISYAFYINMYTFEDIQEAIDNLCDLKDFKAIYTIKEARNLFLSNALTQSQKILYSSNIDKKYLNFKNKHEKTIGKNKCKYSTKQVNNYACIDMVNNYATITSNGDILTCPCDTSLKSIYGNINNTSLLDLFNCNYINNIRQMINNNIFPSSPCIKNCNFNGKIFPGIPLQL